MNPLVITIKNGVVDTAIQCDSDEHAESVFIRIADKNGIEVMIDDLDNGYVERDWATICLVHPIREGDV